MQVASLVDPYGLRVSDEKEAGYLPCSFRQIVGIDIHADPMVVQAVRFSSFRVTLELVGFQKLGILLLQSIAMCSFWVLPTSP